VRVLACPDLTDTAVIVNEFGALGIDQSAVGSCGPGDPGTPERLRVLRCTAGPCQHVLSSVASGREWRPAAIRRLALETVASRNQSFLYTLSADALLERALEVHAVVATIDAIIGAATLDRLPEATAQAACAGFTN